MRNGFSLVDVLVAVALLGIVFVGLSAVLRTSVLVLNRAKSENVMSGLAESQMEYLHGLSYDELGTVDGTPSGPVSADQMTSIDGARYEIRTRIVLQNGDTQRQAQVIVLATNTSVTPLSVVSTFTP